MPSTSPALGDQSTRFSNQAAAHPADISHYTPTMSGIHPRMRSAGKIELSYSAIKIDMQGSSDARFLEIKASGDLPSPTGVALKLLRVSQEEESSLEEISAIIRCDPALSGQLLKLANSSSAAHRRPVISIDAAIQISGIRVIRQLVLGLSVLSANKEGKCPAFDYQGFWTRSLATAAAVQELCAVNSAFQPDEAFTCGLLSGVGRLALATVYPVEYGEILTRMGTRPLADLLEVEQACFSITHLELTKAMLRDWGLPEVPVKAIDGLYGLNNLQPDPESRTGRLAQTLHLAHEISAVHTAEEQLQPALIPSIIALAEQAGFGQETMDAVFNEVTRRWQDWGATMKVPTTEVSALSELIERSRQRLPGLNAVLSATRAKPGLRVLVLEDDPVTLDLLKSRLAAAGHTVATATDGAQGLQYVIDFNPELIIADWMMPEMDGIEFCKALRKTRFGQHVYLIFLTGLEEDQHLVEAFEAGVDDYIVKPSNPEILMARICAGERLIRLQHEIEREKTEVRRFIAELAAANRRLEQAALTDPLTSLPNRRYATRRLEQEWARAVRNGHPMTCMIVDVDHFKNINDQHGHAAGDAVLREIAMLLRGAARKDDEVCRTGGEEFLIICANTDIQAAQATAERIRAAMEKYSIVLSDKTFRVTISIGVATQRASESNPDALLRAADMAAYAAKRRGRNRVCVISGAVPLALTAA
jgi:diguanylate cyclase (GGDEF)-like protein